MSESKTEASLRRLRARMDSNTAALTAAINKVPGSENFDGTHESTVGYASMLLEELAVRIDEARRHPPQVMTKTSTGWGPAVPLGPQGPVARLEAWMLRHSFPRVAALLARFDERGLGR